MTIKMLLRLSSIGVSAQRESKQGAIPSDQDGIAPLRFRCFLGGGKSYPGISAIRGRLLPLIVWHVDLNAHRGRVPGRVRGPVGHGVDPPAALAGALGAQQELAVVRAEGRPLDVVRGVAVAESVVGLAAGDGDERD